MAERVWRGGMIGAGVWSDNQLNGWAQVPNARIVALCDQQPERLAMAAEKHNIAQTFTDARTMLETAALDFVDICTRPESHAPLIRLAAEHSLPILCQKPFCTSLEEAHEMVQLCDQRGVRLMVNENFRWQVWYRQIKTLLDEGAVGEPFRAHIHWRMRATLPTFHHRQAYFQHMPRLAVYELGVHYLDVFRYLFGNPDVVFARLQRVSEVIAGEDVENIMLVYDRRNLTCQINHSWASVPLPGVDSEAGVDPWNIAHPIEIDGTAGTLVLRADRTLTLYTDDGAQSWSFPEDTRRQSLGTTVGHFIHCLDTTTEFETNGRDYLDTMRLVYASYQSSENAVAVRV